jgi:hypothetical protein
MKKIIYLLAFLFAFTANLSAAEETLQSKQIASCERIGYPEWRDDCFESLGRDVLSYSVCLKISNEDRRERCVRIHPPKSEYDCLKDAATSDSCLRHLKQSTNDLELCKKIKDHNIKRECFIGLVSNEKDANIALEFLAKQQQDSTLCDLIDVKTAKTSCVANISKKNTVEGCENPQTVAEYKQCKQFALLQAEEMKTVRKAPKAKAQAKQIKVSKPAPAPVKKAENKSANKAAKLQAAKDARALKAEEKADKLQAEKDAREAKLQEAKDARTAKAQEKTDKLQAVKDAREAKLQEAKDARAAKAQEKADKLQAVKDAREAKRQEAKETKISKQTNKAVRVPAQAVVKEEIPQVSEPVVEEPVESPVPIVEEDTEPIAEAPTEESPQVADENQVEAEPIIEQTTGEAPEPTVEQEAAAIAKTVVEETIAKELPKKTKAQERTEQLQKAKEERAAKAQEKADKLKAAKDAIEQNKAEKIQKAKEAKEALANEKAEKLQRIKTEREAKEQEKAERLKKAKEAKMPSSKPTETMNTNAVASSTCTKGFGSWTEPPQKKNDEIACDKENIDQFATLLNSCMASDHNINILSFDMNKDLCVTCDDLKQWQKQVKKLFEAKKRSTDARYLMLKECAERKF